MLGALDRILKYTAGMSEVDFLANGLIQDAVIRNIGVLGEAANQLLDVAPEFSSNHPEIPLAQIYGMRNRMIHGYASVNPVVVWDCVEVAVQELRGQILQILERLA